MKLQQYNLVGWLVLKWLWAKIDFFLLAGVALRMVALINGIIKDDTNATNRFIPISKKLVAARDASEVRELTFRMLMNFFECSTGQETIGAFHNGRRVNLRFLE